MFSTRPVLNSNSISYLGSLPLVKYSGMSLNSFRVLFSRRVPCTVSLKGSRTLKQCIILPLNESKYYLVCARSTQFTSLELWSAAHLYCLARCELIRRLVNNISCLHQQQSAFSRLLWRWNLYSMIHGFFGLQASPSICEKSVHRFWSVMVEMDCVQPPLLNSIQIGMATLNTLHVWEMRNFPPYLSAHRFVFVFSRALLGSGEWRTLLCMLRHQHSTKTRA